MAIFRIVHSFVVIVALAVVCSAQIPEALSVSNDTDALTTTIIPDDVDDVIEDYDNSTHDHNAAHGVKLASLHFDYVRNPLGITIFLLIVALCKLGFHHAKFLSSKVPESCLLIILGTIVGAILHFAGADGIYFAEFSSDLFFLYLLPPIILEAAYSLHDRVFFENLGTILLYAVLGTILNCFILAPALYGLSIAGAMGPISITLSQCFVFGALIVAVDPVAVLAIFQEIGVNNTLYFLVFGESLLNDAVTVVIYNTMKSFVLMETIPVAQIFLGIGAFFTVSLGGLAIGVLIGAICAFCTKYTGHVRVVEPLAVFALAYISYLLAELFHFSGIISIIGCGLMQAEYSFQNLSPKSHITVVYFCKMISTTCDSIIFLYLGLSLVRDAHVWHTGFALWSLLLCLVIRFIVVYFLTFFANRFQRLRKMDREEQFIMAYGGLRGAVAYSLASLLDKETISAQPIFMTTTLIIIIFTVFVQGISIKPLVKCLHIASNEESPVSLYEEITTHMVDHVLAGIEQICGHYGHNRLWEKMNELNYHYIRHWLMKNPKTKDDHIMHLYEKITLQMHFENTSNMRMWKAYASTSNLYNKALINSPVDDPALQAENDQLPMNNQFVQDGILFRGRSSSMGQKSNAESQRNIPSTDGNMPGFRAENREDRASVVSIGDRSDSSMDAEAKGAGKRRKSRRFSFARRHTITGVRDEPENEEVTLDSVRGWLVANPSNKVFHRKYDPNLTQHDNSDLVHHLNEKVRRNRRRMMSLGVLSFSPQPTPFGSPLPTPHGSPRPTPFGSPFPTPFASPQPTPFASPGVTPRGSPRAPRRPKTVLNIITEHVPLQTPHATPPITADLGGDASSKSSPSAEPKRHVDGSSHEKMDTESNTATETKVEKDPSDGSRAETPMAVVRDASGSVIKRRGRFVKQKPDVAGEVFADEDETSTL